MRVSSFFFVIRAAPQTARSGLVSRLRRRAGWGEVFQASHQTLPHLYNTQAFYSVTPEIRQSAFQEDGNVVMKQESVPITDALVASGHTLYILWTIYYAGQTVLFLCMQNPVRSPQVLQYASACVLLCSQPCMRDCFICDTIAALPELIHHCQI